MNDGRIVTKDNYLEKNKKEENIKDKKDNASDVKILKEQALDLKTQLQMCVQYIKTEDYDNASKCLDNVDVCVDEINSKIEEPLTISKTPTLNNN